MVECLPTVHAWHVQVEQQQVELFFQCPVDRLSAMRYQGEVKELLSGDRDGPTYFQIGFRLNMGEGALRMAVLRLRRRYGELLRHEIAQTVGHQEEVDEEMRLLLGLISE